jgi:hypothetical protein
MEVPPTVVIGHEDLGPDLPTERIDPAQLLGVAVLLALALSAPSLIKAIDGRVSLFTAGWYFGWAVLLCALGIWLLWAVWHMYRRPLDEQRRRDWEQARVDRLAALEAENLARVDAERTATEVAVRAEAEALRAAEPPEPVERVDEPSFDSVELPRSLRDAMGTVSQDAGGSVALSDRPAGSR